MDEDNQKIKNFLFYKAFLTDEEMDNCFFPMLLTIIILIAVGFFIHKII